MANQKTAEPDWDALARAFADEGTGVHVALEAAGLPKDVFKGADLRGANFDNAILSGYDFSDADLSGASFKLAVLSRANFTNAKLQNANFADSTLLAANFTGAKVSGMRVKGARITTVGVLPRGLSGLLRAARALPKGRHVYSRINVPTPGMTVRDSEINQAFAERLGLSRAFARQFTQGYSDVLKAYVLKGATVKLGDFGNLRLDKASGAAGGSGGPTLRLRSSKRLGSRLMSMPRASAKK